MDNDDINDESIKNVHFIQCYCEGQCPLGEEKGFCKIPSGGGKCFAAMQVEKEETGEEYTTTSYGCLENDQMAILQCKGAQVPHLNKKNIQCCNDTDFCNKNLYSVGVSEQNFPVLVLAGSVVSLLLILLIILVIFLKYRRKNSNQLEENNNVNENLQNKDLDNSLSIVELSSGSGSGLPVMVQRTIAKQIDLEKVIGKGRYGEVWLAKWRGENVAAKIFLTTQEKSWYHETEIYKTVLMRHENILGFIAADVNGAGGWTQLLLITEYHENGSLYDYLQENDLNIDLLLSMSLGIAKGLSHLHTEIFAVPGKCSIAHRDLKSKNILVKKNLDCCIADFGLAVKYDCLTKTVDVPLTDRSGTKRYMAPEILSNKINYENFDSHKMADIYAFGLMLWEISRRCYFDENKALDYQIPFCDLVATDPDFNEMQTVVCSKKIRPSIPEFWENHYIMKMISKIIEEMWHDNPAVRLTSLRVKKTLDKLILIKDLNLEVSKCLERE